MKAMYYALGLLLLFGVVFAAAAALPVNGGVLQAGLDSNLVCDPDGVKVDGWVYENDDLTVIGVRIAGIDAACEGSEMHVDVYDGLTQLGGDFWLVTAGGGTHTFSFGGAISAVDINEIHVGITT
jgi:hypothetical protein